MELLFNSATVVNTFGQIFFVATCFKFIKERGAVIGYKITFLIDDKIFPPFNVANIVPKIQLEKINIKAILIDFLTSSNFKNFLKF